jgi:BirA family biotin operon repressor/biotin-[acetyl-CoA-carboxylase] ligase
MIKLDRGGNTNTEILNILIKNKGDFISGEEISERLNVSRTAIWKHIEELRAVGFEIESRRRTGYMLVKSPDRLFPSLLRNGLETSFIGRDYHYLDSVDSTNNHARGLAVRGFTNGIVVAAEEQVGGKGRRGRVWASPYAQGIWMSVILKPEIVPQKAPGLTLLAAVAVSKTVNRICSLPAVIKWPNDVLVNERKVCGILTELAAEPELIHHAIIGIGLNVNTLSFPAEIEDTATSLAKEAGMKFDRISLMQALLFELEQAYITFSEQGMVPIIELWRQCSSTLGRKVKIVTASQTFEGYAEDIEPDGRLKVKKDTGETVFVSSADVSLR